MRTIRCQLGDGWFRQLWVCRNKFLCALFCGVLVLVAGPTRGLAQGKTKKTPLPNAPLPQGMREAVNAQAHHGRSMEGPAWTVTPCTKGACTAESERVGLCCGQRGNLFRDYVRQQTYRLYTPRQLATLAVRDVEDPFNLMAVVGSAAILVGSNSHSIYGPGLKGLARASGVGLTEDMTDEFFGTFVIPSLDHQEPGFRRMPNRPLLNRLLHCGTQIFWTRSQTGVPMFNYSSVVGTIAEQGVAVTYVPFRRTGWGAAAQRVGLDYATAPIGNLINEFVPQVASHINVRLVFFQNIINRVATTVGQPSGP